VRCTIFNIDWVCQFNLRRGIGTCVLTLSTYVPSTTIRSCVWLSFLVGVLSVFILFYIKMGGEWWFYFTNSAKFDLKKYQKLLIDLRKDYQKKAHARGYGKFFGVHPKDNIFAKFSEGTCTRHTGRSWVIQASALIKIDKLPFCEEVLKMIADYVPPPERVWYIYRYWLSCITPSSYSMRF